VCCGGFLLPVHRTGTSFPQTASSSIVPAANIKIINHHLRSSSPPKYDVEKKNVLPSPTLVTQQGTKSSNIILTADRLKGHRNIGPYKLINIAANYEICGDSPINFHDNELLQLLAPHW
jgi:hypothetical protein